MHAGRAKMVLVTCLRRKAEASGKDYEAIISRAVLLKPLAGILKSYPNIYEVNVTCVEVGCRDSPPGLYSS